MVCDKTKVTGNEAIAIADAGIRTIRDRRRANLAAGKRGGCATSNTGAGFEDSETGVGWQAEDVA